MKMFIGILMLLTSLTAGASPVDGSFRCTYTIERPGKPAFVMVGNIVGSDSLIGSDPVTYLTLQPPSVSDIPLDARILITGWDYHPMHLHPRGDTVTVIASAFLTDAGGVINHVDSAGVKYTVSCLPR